MHIFQNYHDLRKNRQRQTSDISLWPSFTDIMTVILMIFMLTMIVVIIKNSNLAQQLRIREKRVKLVEKSLAESKQIQEDLKIFIMNLEEKLRAKEMEIILLGDEKKIMQSSLEAKLAIISALKGEIKEFEEDVKKLEEEIESSEAETAQLKKESERRIAEISEKTKKQIEEFNRKFAVLMDQLSKNTETIVILDAEKKDLELTLAKQRQAYSILEEKYHKLIRPARSPLGKKVVAVHYSRINSKYRILFKDLNSTDFKEVDSRHLHQRLHILKNDLQDNLYVKIIIPEESGLSYNEAWSFTKDILSRYDYYYQEKKKVE